MSHFDLRHYLPAGATVSLPIDDYEVLIRHAIQRERERIIKDLWKWTTSYNPQPRSFNSEEQLREFLNPNGEQK